MMILSVHRFLVLKRSVLHRDFSINNVLMYPEHEEGPDGKEIFIKDPPKFIDEVLPPFGYDAYSLLLVSTFSTPVAAKGMIREITLGAC